MADGGRMKHRPYILSLLLILTLTACTPAVRLDSPDYQPDYEPATLTFETDDLETSYWWFPGAPWNLLYMRIFSGSLADMENVEHTGTVRLKADEKEKSFPIPSGRDMQLAAYYHGSSFAWFWDCEAFVCFRPEKGRAYDVLFELESKSCALVLRDAETQQIMEASCDSPYPNRGHIVRSSTFPSEAIFLNIFLP